MYQDNQSILPCFRDLAMMQTCVEEISGNLDHSLSSILKDATCNGQNNTVQALIIILACKIL